MLTQTQKLRSNTKKNISEDQNNLSELASPGPEMGTYNTEEQIYTSVKKAMPILCWLFISWIKQSILKITYFSPNFRLLKFEITFCVLFFISNLINPPPRFGNFGMMCHFFQ